MGGLFSSCKAPPVTPSPVPPPLTEELPSPAGTDAGDFFSSSALTFEQKKTQPPRSGALVAPGVAGVAGAPAQAPTASTPAVQPPVQVAAPPPRPVPTSPKKDVQPPAAAPATPRVETTTEDASLSRGATPNSVFEEDSGPTSAFVAANTPTPSPAPFVPQAEPQEEEAIGEGEEQEAAPVGPTVALLVKKPDEWNAVFLHFSADGAPWTDAPGLQLRPNPTEGNGAVAPTKFMGDSGWHTFVMPASRLDFCVNDGCAQWDNNGGANYSVGTGGFTLDAGVVTPIPAEFIGPNAFQVATTTPADR